MGTWFPFLRFQPQRIDFGIGLAALTKFTVIFRFVEAVVFDILGLLNSA